MQNLFNNNREIYSTLIKSGAHLASKRCNPFMYKYIYGYRKNYFLFDLNKTLYLFKTALEFLKQVKDKGGSFIFYTDNLAFAKVCKPFFASQPYISLITGNWLGGTITNWKKIHESNHKLEKPTILIVYLTGKSITPLNEAFKADIPTVAFLNANICPRKVTYPIPCNTKSLKTFYIYIFTILKILIKTEKYLKKNETLQN